MSTHATPVTVVITCMLKPDQVQVAQQALAAVIKTVMEKEPACRGIRVHQDPDRPQRLLIIEYWDSKAIFTGPHMETPHMVAFLAQAKSFLDGEATFEFWNEIPLA